VQGTAGRWGITPPVAMATQRQALLEPDAHVTRQQIDKKGGLRAALLVLANGVASDQP
jgi:hypothetical protein